MSPLIIDRSSVHMHSSVWVLDKRDEQALAKQVSKYGESHGRDAYAQAVAPGAAPPQESASTPATVQHAGVLLPNPEKVRRKDPKKEPTYRLRKAMGLV